MLHFGLSFWALRLSGDLSSPAIVMQSYIPMTALLAWWVLGERFAWRTGLAIAVSFGGVLVLGFDPVVLANPAALLTDAGLGIVAGHRHGADEAAARHRRGKPCRAGPR